MKVLVCGSRTWTNRERVEDILDALLTESDGNLTIIEGCCYGPDTFAGDWADITSVEEPEITNIKHLKFPADWKKYGKSAGFKRNLQMLDEKPDLVLAFWDGKSRGTKHTIDEARKRGIKVQIVIDSQ